MDDYEIVKRRRNLAAQHKRRARAHLATSTRTAVNDRVISVTRDGCVNKDGKPTMAIDSDGYWGDVKARVTNVFKLCSDYARATWGVDISGTLIRVDFRTSRRRSSAYSCMHGRWRTEGDRVTGKASPHSNGISIAVVPAMHSIKVNEPWAAVDQNEYPWFSMFGDVGETSLYSGLDLIVAHEAAHVVQYATSRRDANREGHGWWFLTHYSDLRHHLGLIDHSKPLWRGMTTAGRRAAAVWTKRNMPPANRAAWAAEHWGEWLDELKQKRAAHRRQKQRAAQKQRRAAGRAAKNETPAAVTAASVGV